MANPVADRAPPPEDELPSAIPDARRRVRLPYVWILPIIVVIAGVFVAVREKLAEGTSIEITFHTADDLEPNKTKISYKAVEIGEVKEIHVSKDRKEVVVEARIHRNSTDYLVQDTRFWVVRPRVTGANVSGLGTLVSGAYIGVDVGHSAVPEHHFTGLEVPPIVTSGLPGREYILHAGDIGSLNIGSTVFFRHMPAGQVVAYSLDPGGASVTVKVFINSPYDKFVTQDTKFWQASGVDMSIDSEGVKLHTESIASPRRRSGLPVPQGLHLDHRGGGRLRIQALFRSGAGDARDRHRGGDVHHVLQGSLRGLSVGAPVDLRGINIGEVKRLSVEYDRVAGELRFPVEVDIFPQRIRARERTPNAKNSDFSDMGGHTMIDSMVAHGMRASSRTGKLLTGQKYVAVDVVKGAAKETVAWDAHPPISPPPPAASTRSPTRSGASPRSSTRCPSTRSPAI